MNGVKEKGVSAVTNTDLLKSLVTKVAANEDLV